MFTSILTVKKKKIRTGEHFSHVETEKPEHTHNTVNKIQSITAAFQILQEKDSELRLTMSPL